MKINQPPKNANRMNIITIIIIKLIFRNSSEDPDPKKNDDFPNYTIEDHNVVRRSKNEINENYIEDYDDDDEDSEEVEIVYKSGTPAPPEDYDYESLKNDYYDELEKKQHSNTTFNYTDKGEPEETIGDAIHEIVDFHKPKDCSKEENRNFGIRSIECLWDDFKTSHTKMDRMQLFKRIMKILFIWLLICLVIAAILWCKYGKHNILYFYLQRS
jgi:hypothetical protein